MSTTNYVQLAAHPASAPGTKAPWSVCPYQQRRYVCAAVSFFLLLLLYNLYSRNISQHSTATMVLVLIPYYLSR